MAAVNVTLIEIGTHLECDAVEKVITKSLRHMTGVLSNASAVDVWLLVNAPGMAADGVTPITTTPITNTGGRGVVYLPPGASFPVCAHYLTINMVTAAGTAWLQWSPDRSYPLT